MKKGFRRLMSLLLAMVMALSLAVPVMAEELNEDTPVVTQASDEEPLEPATESTEVPSEEQGNDASEELSTKEETASEELPPCQEDVPAPADTPREEQSPTDDNSTNDSGQEEIGGAELTLKVLESAPLPVQGAMTYESSDTDVVTVNEQGMVIARHVGSAEILVTTEAGETLSIPVTVPATTTTTETKLSVGGSTTLKLKDRDLERVECSNSKIASVDDKGVVKAKKSGVTEITMIDTLGDLHIVNLKVRATISDREISVSEEKSVQLELQGSEIVKVRSSNEDVAVVDGDGTVTGVEEGTAVVTLTDASGSTSKCKVTVNPNYLARTAKNAKRIYRKIETLGCRHVSGVHTYEQMVKRRHATCTTGASLALQAAGVLDKGKWVTHTDAGGEGRKLRDPDKAIRRRKDLKKGTFTLYKANCRYSRLPAKYKQAGMVYVQDSNICVSAGDGYIYSCNQSSRQYRHGHYFNTKVKSGYTHSHKILYVIAPNS